jgi:hypothetical protein
VAPVSSFTEVRSEEPSVAAALGTDVKPGTAAGDDGEVFYIFYENEETGEGVKSGLDLQRYIHEEVNIHMSPLL